MSKRNNGRKMREKKHSELGFKRGHALKKVTGKSELDWSFLAKKYPLKAREIKRHKDDQDFLKALKEKMETE